MPLHRLSGKKLFLFFIVCLALPFASCAQQELKNLPEYSLPLTNDKLVIAHNMTGIIRFQGHDLEDSANPKYYKPTGNISETLGGLTQVNVIADSLLSNATLDEAVEFEMRAALRSGIDGFQFYYILGLQSWDDIIKAYFRVAEKKNIPFKFTFCISHPEGRTEADKIEEFAKRINGIMNEVGHDNRYWLRTPDGRLIIYMWNGEGLADIPKDKKELPDAYYIARAYKRLADKVNERFACVFSINEQISKTKLNSFLDYFPATWIWTLAYNKDYVGPMVADACLARGRTFTGSVFGDFYTSKLLRKGTWNMYHRVDEAVTDGIEKVERRYVVTGLSYNFRKLLEFGISRDVPIINVITWNDYPEGHHLAPEVNHNYGFSVLLNHYKNLWKKNSIAPKDIAIAFFKKYQHKVKPQPYNIPVVQFEPGAVPERFEDSIDVVTILSSSAALEVNGEKKPVAGGLKSTKFPSKPGAVEVSVLRDGKQTVHFITPEWITDKPYRTDRLTYVYSSEDTAYHKDIFDNTPPIQSTEYNKQAKQ